MPAPLQPRPRTLQDAKWYIGLTYGVGCLLIAVGFFTDHASRHHPLTLNGVLGLLGVAIVVTVAVANLVRWLRWRLRGE